MQFRRFSILAVLAAAAAVYPVSARADVNGITITALSNGSNGSFLIENQEESLMLGKSLENGTLRVDADRQVMIFCDAEKDGTRSGGVIVVLGPAEIEIRIEDSVLALTVKSGRVIADASCAQSAQLVVLRAGSVELPLGQGETDLLVNGANIEIGYSGADALRLTIASSPRTIASNSRMMIQGDQVQTGDLASWRAQNGFELARLVEELGVKSAREVRFSVQSRLLDNVIAWDKYAQAQNITPEQEANAPKPEIRQVATTVSNSAQTQTNRSGSPSTPGVQGANEFPSVSPAAISVGGALAANQLNDARSQLTQNQSRGLGFNGPSQLATPGLTGGGRTVGPSGLGAGNR